jgi:hypothetical protein
MASPDAAVAERYFSPIQVQVFPSAPKTLMSRSAALHLYRLLQQYGWCLAVDEYASRWTCFWPRLKPVERAMLIYIVKAHCAGEFGRRLVISRLPVDFEPFESDMRAADLTAEVECELETVLDAYCSTVAGNDKIRAWIEATCPAEYRIIEGSDALGRVFGDGAWVCPDQLCTRCAEVLHENGIDKWTAARSAAAVGKSLFGFYESLESLA